MSDAVRMQAAIFGLIGVVVGALVNGGIASVGVRRASRADRQVAARLVRMEVDDIETSLSVAAEMNISLDDFPIGTPAWDEHKALLARGLNHQEWTSLSAGYGQLAFLNLDLRGIEPGNALTEQQREATESTSRALSDAAMAVKPFAEGWHPRLDRSSAWSYRRALRASNKRRV